MDSYTSNVYMGILEIVGLQGGPDSVLQAAVVLENEVVVDSLPDVPSAFAVLFGLIYVLHIEYPPGWKFFFEAVQRIFLSLDAEKCSTRVQRLRTKLSQYNVLELLCLGISDTN